MACVNVGLLILAQTSTRASEFAVRTALGASRGRILTQVFVEFMVLAVMAAGAGLLILDWLSGRLLTALGITLPYWIDPALSAATAIRGLALAAGCAVVDRPARHADGGRDARTQAALVDWLRRGPGVRGVTFATALPRMDHPVRLMEVDDDTAAVAASTTGPFKVRTARIAIDFLDELERPLVAGRG